MKSILKNTQFDSLQRKKYKDLTARNVLTNGNNLSPHGLRILETCYCFYIIFMLNEVAINSQNTMQSLDCLVEWRMVE